MRFCGALALAVEGAVQQSRVKPAHRIVQIEAIAT